MIREAGRSSGHGDILTDDENKKIEAETRSEFLLHAILDNTTDLVWSVDRDYKLLFFNTPFKNFIHNLTGKQIESGNEIINFLPDFYKDDLMDLATRAMSGEQFSVERVSHDGTREIMVEYFINPIRTELNDVIGLSVFMRDITARKKADEKLIESESGRADAQRLAQNGNWDFDVATGRLTWSDELYRIFGANKNTFTENHGSFLHLVDEADREKLLQASQLACKKGEPFEIEYHITIPSGERRVIHELGFSERNAEGKVIRLFGTAQNITARKKAEKALVDSEKRYRYLFENNPMPMWVIDRNTLLYLDVNEATLKHYGYSRKEFLSMSSLDLRPENERDRYKKFLLEKSGDPCHFGIWKHIKKNGSIIQVETIVHDIDFDQRKACLVLVNDLTDKLKADAEIQSSYLQMKELTAHLQRIREEERTRIAREIHDDLGQQLTGLKMDASWISKKIATENRSVQEKLSGMISLIDETVKTVRRISSELRPGILDDLGLIPALEWQSQEFEKRTGIKSQFHTPLSDLKPEKNLATNIFRVYQEALTNVARHSQATQIESTLEEQDGYLRLCIKDNGRGFDVDEAKNRNSWGLIGMKERALIFHGELIIESEQLMGTVVILKVPLAHTGKIIS